MTTLTNDALVPVFATKFRRHARQLDLPDASVEIAFDEGTIEAGARQEVLSEIELELKSGNAGVLFDLGTQLLDAGPLRFSTRSKSERGFALAFNVVQPAAKADPSGISAEHLVDDVIARLVGSCWHHLLKNHAVAENGSDPEGVYQMRVALRRLRTVCALFRRDIPSPSFQAVNGEARWLMHKACSARRGIGTRSSIPTVTTAWSGRLPVSTSMPCARRSNGSANRAMPRCRPFSPIRVAAAFLLSLKHLVERRGWRNEIDSCAGCPRNRCRRIRGILMRLHRKAFIWCIFPLKSMPMRNTISGPTSRSCTQVCRASLRVYATSTRRAKATHCGSPIKGQSGTQRVLEIAPASCSMLSGRTISPHFILPSARWRAGKPATRLRWRKRCARDGDGSRSPVFWSR